jgi:GT2 family glycosyltransferase
MKHEQSSIPQARIAIITVTYNASTFVTDYLQSIEEYLKHSDSIAIIVDNHSTDDTSSVIENYLLTNPNKQIIFNQLSKNIGFGKGCNHAAKIAERYSPKYLWILNPDTTINAQSGLQLEKLLNHRPDISFTGSTLVNQKGEPRPGAFRFPKLLNIALSNLRLGILDKIFKNSTTAGPLATTPTKSDWLTGASFMVKTECFIALQGFDPHYFLYFEEVDLFKRAEQLGYEAWSCPDSHVYHISGASTGINKQDEEPKRQPPYWFESRRHYYLSNYNYLYFILADATFLICHALWLIRAKLQKKINQTPPHFALDTIYHGQIKPLFKKKR